MRKLQSIALLFAAHVVYASSPAVSSVPFTLVDNRIFIDVLLNDKGPYRLMFDTGGGNLLHTDIARALSLPVDPAGKLAGTGAALVERGYASVARVRVAGLSLENQRFLVIPNEDGPNVFGKARYEGLLGRELMEKYVVRIDYQNKRLDFYDPASFRYDGNGQRLIFERTYHLPVVEAEIDGHPARLGLDTGARTSLVLYSGFIASSRLRERNPPRFTGITGWGIGGPIRSDLTRIPTVKLGPFVLHDVVSRLTTMTSGLTVRSDIAGLAGPDILKRFVTWIDASRGEVILEPGPAFDAPERYDQSGMWLGQSGDAFVVLDVMPSGPADQAGVHVGDQVLRVDGRESSTLLLPEVRDSFRTRGAGAVIRLAVVRREGRKTIDLVLKDFLPPERSSQSSIGYRQARPVSSLPPSTSPLL